MAFFRQFGKALPGSQTVLKTKEEPFKDRDVIVSQKDVEELRQQLDDLCTAGIICPYDEVRPAPKGVTINMVYKMCYDYQWFTEQTIPELYDDHTIESMINFLLGYRVYTVIGLLSSLSQVPTYPEERKQPYSIRPVGFYESERMQPGYCEMLTNYQKMVGYILRDLHMKEMVAFLDYIVIFASTYEEHEERIVRTLEKLQKGGLKVALDKSIFCSGEFMYAGHMVLDRGIMIASEKVDTLLRWPVPKTVVELQNFLEFCAYYRHFYLGFSAMAKPLYQLLHSVTQEDTKEETKEPSKEETEKPKEPSKEQTEKPKEASKEETKEASKEETKEASKEETKEAPKQKKKPWWTRASLEGKWTEECDVAFKGLKNAFARAPMLEREKMSANFLSGGSHS